MVQVEEVVGEKTDIQRRVQDQERKEDCTEKGMNLLHRITPKI